MVNGQTAWEWESKRSNDIWSFSQKKGESTQQALGRVYQSSLQIGFNGLVLPPYVFTPLAANGLGTTQLSSASR